MENLEVESPFRVMGCLGTVVVAVLVGLFALAACEGIEASRADRAQARASAEWARVAAIEANAARDRESNLHREQMFMLWSAAVLAPGDGFLVVVSVVLGAVAAWAVVQWLDRREVF